MALGDPQEARAKQWVQWLGYRDVTAGENEIKSLLNLKVVGGAESKCADIVGFKPDFTNAIGAMVCESKGTDVEHSLVQLGNVAAAILERFHPASWLVSNLILVVYRSSVVKRPIDDSPRTGYFDSPGPGYRVGQATRFGMHVLLDAGTLERKPAPAVATLDVTRLDPRLIAWRERVAKLPVYVYVEP